MQGNAHVLVPRDRRLRPLPACDSKRIFAIAGASDQRVSN